MAQSELLLNLHPEPYAGYKFHVYIQALPMGFSKISRMEDFVETEALQEGGVNDYVHSLYTPVQAERTMVFERGMAFRGVLAAGLAAQFQVGQRIHSDIIITVSGRDGTLKNLFLVHGAVVKKWSCSDLDAMSSEVLIERLEVVYETLESYPTASALAGAAGVDFL